MAASEYIRLHCNTDAKKDRMLSLTEECEIWWQGFAQKTDIKCLVVDRRTVTRD